MSDKSTAKYIPRLKKEFNDTYKSELKKELGLSNINAVPSLEKIVINIGLGKSKDDKKMFEVATNTIEKITGQKPIMTYSKVNVASFKLREGNKIGMKVTLRGDRMFEFLDRFVNIVMPRQRDFHGVSNKSFDSQGNFSIGVVEQSIFPELSFEETTSPHGLQVVIVTKSNGKEEARALLVKFGVPFMKEGK
ncbi:50S ribosomal protein L5 [Candidatus Saccharibacteria bacterium RIFCSPHIGHO2_12_FULL_41_12]|nr:MAG: 50S ribosomal protein L5 [Candidatus Saccharibacteria bacterium RIFCSPHIGHO2_12_FULL_41_12]